MLNTHPPRLDHHNLRVLRKSLGLKQAAFANEIGVDQATVSRWERGQTPFDPAVFSMFPDVFYDSADRARQTISFDSVLLEHQWPALIRYYRATRGLTLERLAELLNVDISTVFRWESGTYRPGLAHQRVLRDLVLTPLETSSQFNRMCERLKRTRFMVALSMGSVLLAVSAQLERLHAANGYDLAPMSDIESFHDGKFLSWIEARHRAGFYRGDVIKSTGRYLLSPTDARAITVYPVPIEDGRIISVSIHRSIDHFSFDPADDACFTIHQCDELLS